MGLLILKQITLSEVKVLSVSLHTLFISFLAHLSVDHLRARKEILGQ